MVNHAPRSSLFFLVTQLSPISRYTVCWYAAWYKKSISQFLVPLVANCYRLFSSVCWKKILLSLTLEICSFILINDVNYLSFQRAFFFSFCCCCCCLLISVDVELCRPVLYDVRNQSSFIAGGGGRRGRSEHFGGTIWFSGGMDGEQLSLTDCKGGYTKLTANEAGSLKYYRYL